jgi:DNA-directed RNA polymerase specialized sigma24 family protein
VGTKLELPRLKPTRYDQIRLVLKSCLRFNPEDPCGPKRFRKLNFYHPLFTGSGKSLLRWLGVGSSNNAYWILIAKLYPEISGHFFLTKNFNLKTRKKIHQIRYSCREDVAFFMEALLLPSGSDGKPVPPFSETLGMFQGGFKEEPSPEELLLKKEQINLCLNLMDKIDARVRRVLIWRFGLYNEHPHSYSEIASKLNLSAARIEHMIRSGLRTLRAAHRRAIWALDHESVNPS